MTKRTRFYSRTAAQITALPVSQTEDRILFAVDTRELFLERDGVRSAAFSDKIEVASRSDLPAAPLSKLYVTTDTGKIYIPLVVNGALKWQDVSQSGTGNVTGGASAEIWTYDDTNRKLYLDTETDMTQFTVGQKLTLNLPSDDGEAWQTAEIASIDATNHALVLSASLYNTTFTASSQVGLDKVTCSGYAKVTYLATTCYRVTVSGASTNTEFWKERQLKTYAAGVIASNTIFAVAGNYVYLSSAAVGTTALLLGKSAHLIQFELAGDEDTSTATGNKNLVSGDRASASGSWNSVSGMCSFAHGASNVISKDLSGAIGTENKIEDVNSFAIGVNNKVPESFCFVVGGGNEPQGQGQFVFGSGNKGRGINAFMIGNNNEGNGLGSVQVGSSNKINGAAISMNCLQMGHALESSAKQSIMIGQHGTLTDSPENYGAFVICGGERNNPVQSFIHRINKSILNPEYNSSLDTGNTGTDSKGNKKFIEDRAYSTEYKGHLLGEIAYPDATDGSTIALDHDLKSEWYVLGSGTVNFVTSNWHNGDFGLLLVDTTDITPVFPADWQGDLSMAETGMYAIRLEQHGGFISAEILYKFLPSNISGTFYTTTEVIAATAHVVGEGKTVIPVTLLQDCGHDHISHMSLTNAAKPGKTFKKCLDCGDYAIATCDHRDATQTGVDTVNYRLIETCPDCQCKYSFACPHITETTTYVSVNDTNHTKTVTCNACTHATSTTEAHSIIVRLNEEGHSYVIIDESTGLQTIAIKCKYCNYVSTFTGTEEECNQIPFEPIL